MWRFTPYAVPLFFGAALCFAVAIFTWQRRSVHGAPYLFWSAVSLPFYLLGYAMELGSPSLDLIQFWLKVQYIGVTIPQALFFALILSYTGSHRLITPYTLLLLFAIPSLTLIFAWTNELHGLIWQNMAFEVVQGASITTFDRGVWYWVHVVYYWLIMIAGLVRLGISLPKASGDYRRQLITMLVGALLPLPLYVIYLARVLPINLDLNPFAFTLSALIFGIAISQYKMLDIVPVAHQAVFHSMPEAVIVLDPQYRVADINPYAEILFGRRASESFGLLGAQVLSEWQELIEKAQTLESGKAELMIPIYGKEQVFELEVSTLRDDRMEITGKVLLLRDITPRVEAQRKLQETNERLVALSLVDRELMRRLDVRYVADIALDAAMRMTGADAGLINVMEAAGPRVLRTVGAYPADAVGKAMSEDMGITRRVMTTRAAEMVLDVSQDPDYHPVIPDMKAQISIPLEVGDEVIGVITLETSRPEHFTQEAFDLLKLLATRVAAAMDNARMYQEREKLVHELQAFAHTVAHDLKNPLSNIKGYGVFLRDYVDKLDEEKRADMVRVIINNADKAAEIINALLMLAGAHSSNKVDTTPLEMGEIVETVRKRLDPQIGEYHAELVARDDWPTIIGYRPWVEQVWVNYMINALKYGGTPPRVEIGCDAPENGHIRFWVRDNGKGLTAEEQANLFQSFSRLENALDKEGHGLGLSIVQRITERLGGTVGIESKPGEGSVFWFTLPHK